jgi:phage head maturation protease
MELSPNNYDFAGWATRSNQLCADGRTIMPDAFKHHDGEIVPLIWNHQHNDPFAILGKALLHCVDGDVYAYCAFNDTESGNTAKELVKHGDVCSLSICANKLQHNNKRGVTHGMIRELSLVVAGANPQARIETVALAHSEDGVEIDDEIHVYTEEAITLYHSEEKSTKEDEKVAEETKKTEGEKTVADVFNTLNEEQKTVVYALIGEALENAGAADDDEGDDEMKHNVFDGSEMYAEPTLTHADQEAIVNLAKQSSIGTLQEALRVYADTNDTLAHGLDLGDAEVLEELLPDYKLLNPGAPELLGPDQSWVMGVINKIHKSPYSRIRTRHADARAKELQDKLKAKGYKKGEEKKLTDNIKLINRSFDPQTIYIKDSMHRDDIIDITDFDNVAYIWNLMKGQMYETLALAALIGDGRDDIDPDKIKEEHIKPIWHDEELYTMHVDVDIEAARQELQGTETNAHFGENYIYAEAIITASLYAREKFKGSGRPDFYCDPHLMNVMLLARDLNGRRIYDSKADLAKALNVNDIIEIEQLTGKTREAGEGKTKQLLGLFVNLADYQFGSTKGGEVTKFTDFDINFNTYTYLMETRLSGALVKPESAIALELPVAAD